MKPGRAGIAVLAAAGALLLAAAAAPGWRWGLPAGVTPPPVPADNAMSAAKVALGRRLFYEGDLSIDGTMSCATCHSQKRGFADDNRTRAGVHGDPGRRNVPGLANVAFLPSLNWDGAAPSLEAQALIPMFGTAPVEMGMHGQERELVRRLEGDACYRRMFARAFPESGGRIDVADVTRALGAFQRTLISFGAPWDRWRAGDRSALSAEARQGADLFGQRCAACHAGPSLSDGRFHAIGAAGEDQGLGALTGRAEDAGRFRTPSLRNVALSAPYLHDGSARDLAEAIAAHGRDGALTPPERDAVIAFLSSLTDPAFATDPRHARPTRACGRRL